MMKRRQSDRNCRSRAALGIAAVVFYTLLSVGVGCASSQPKPTPRLEVSASNYDAAFDSVLETLRSERFILDRVDRRLGIIIAKPRTSASAMEPWKGDNATVSQALESTIHYQRRVIRIDFEAFGQGTGGAAPAIEPTDGRTTALNQITPSNPPIFEAANHPGTLTVTVKAFIERGHRPGMQIQPLALRMRNITTDPALRERDIPSQFWEPIDRDPYMETELATLIARSAPESVRVVQPDAVD